MERDHFYKVDVKWTGNKGSGTSNYSAYDRDFVISAEGKQDIVCSSDPAFMGKKELYNPEELLVSSVSSCHMLWFLHLCANHGIVVESYQDQPVGIMSEDSDGGGRFTRIELNPLITVKEMVEESTMDRLQNQAHEFCFVAASLTCEIAISVTVKRSDE